MAIIGKCLECECSLTVSDRGHARRFCCTAHKNTFNNRAQASGAPFYHLIRAWRRERSKAKKLGLWNAICQLELYFDDRDKRLGKKTYMPPEFVLDDIQRLDMIPTTNVSVRTA